MREDESVSVRNRRIYYGWTMLPLAMLAMFASSPGQTYGVSIFNESIRSSLELSHSEFAFAYTLGTILGAFPIAFIGTQMDRFGIRTVILFALPAFCMACLALAFTRNWLMLFLAFSLLRMLGPGTLAFMSSNVLAFWFQRRLGTVEAVRQLSMSLSIAVVPILNVWLLRDFGWRWAYGIWSVALGVTLFPLFLVCFRNRPEEVGQTIDHQQIEPDNSTTATTTEGLPELTLPEALRSEAFYVLAAGTALFAMILTAMTFHLVPILAEKQLSAETAATTLVTSACVMAAAQLLGGICSDRMRGSWLVFIGLLALSGTMLMFLSATTAVQAGFAGGMMGFAQGFYFSATQPLWVRFFGRKQLGRIRGVVMTVMVASSSLGPLLTGLGFDLTGSFRPVLVTFCMLPIPLACCAFLVRPPRASH